MNRQQKCKIMSELKDLGSSEPIAIIGLDFTFPGNAVSEKSLWDILMKGHVNSPRPYREYLDGNTSHIDVNGGSDRCHFIDADVSRFDAPFFSITAAEAASMDPQQRLLLESTYRALENAGIPLETIQGSKTSVHVGCFTNDYNIIQTKDPDTMPVYHATGNSSAMLSNRISWFFNLNGSSTTVDTACSSTLVATDQACQSLRLGTSTMAIVGGCNLISTPESSITVQKMGFLSPDGLCHSFDDRANGYARGEGIGTIILKRLSKALEDDDSVRALIRATCVNQDGRTRSITQPSQQAQEALLRQVFGDFALDLSPVRFVEAHGTGTIIGDNTEAGALAEAFREMRDKTSPVYIGATKSNIGHLEACSGLAGIIKTILVLEKGIIPPIGGLEKLNTRISHLANLEFPTRAIPWPTKGLRRAVVQSFGFGGTNAAVVLDDATSLFRDHGSGEVPRREEQHLEMTPIVTPESLIPKLLVFSARNHSALIRQLNKLSAHYDEAMTSTSRHHLVGNLAYTLSNRRTSFPWRTFAIVDRLSDLCRLPELAVTPTATVLEKGLCLIFTGQGAQCIGMGRELMTYPVFKSSLSLLQGYLEDMGIHWSLLEYFQGTKPQQGGEAEVSQCVCTALQISLIRLIATFNLKPKMVIGHSSGEIAAAYFLGAISARTAMKLAYYRGILADQIAVSHSYNGSMMAVGLSEKDIQSYLERTSRKFTSFNINIGCINSPKSITVSGDLTQLEALKHALEDDKIFVRMLHVPVAYHSPQMKGVTTQYRQLIGSIEGGDNDRDHSATMISSVTGAPVTISSLQNMDYWASNLECPVQFNAAVSHILVDTENNSKHHKFSTSNIDGFLEVGPHSTLQGPIQAILKIHPKHVINTTYQSLLKRNQSSIRSLLYAIGSLHCAGHIVDIQTANSNEEENSLFYRPLVDLPPYPFDRSESYWTESRVSKGNRLGGQLRHPLLGTAVSDWNSLEPRWRQVVRPENLLFLQDHKIDGSIVYPAAAMIAAAVQGVQLLDTTNDIHGYMIQHVKFITALSFATETEEIEVELRLQAKSNETEGYLFRVYSFKNDHWTLHCQGEIDADYRSKVVRELPYLPKLRHSTLRDRFSIIQRSRHGYANNKKLYDALRKRGYEYGPSFQVLQDICQDGKSNATALIQPVTTGPKDSSIIYENYVIHPGVLDSLLQLALVATVNEAQGPGTLLVPSGIRTLWITSEGFKIPETNSTSVIAESSTNSHHNTRAEVLAFTEDTDRVLVSIQGLEGTPVIDHLTTDSHNTKVNKHVCFGVEWRPHVDFLSTSQILELCWDGTSTNKIESDDADFEHDMMMVIFGKLFEMKKQLAEEAIKPPKAYLNKYVNWILQQTQRFLNGDYPAIRERYDSKLNNAANLERIRNRAKADKMWKFYIAIIDSLFEILAGAMDPLDLLFGQNYATDFYTEANHRTRCVPALAKYLDLIAHANPNLRIIELGAGTGSTTRFALDSLAMGAHDRNPAGQGFLTNSYDVVIAASVLHATVNIRETLRNVRDLLKDGGKLILMECVRPEHLKLAFAFGLLPGWWLGIEDFRQDSPNLSKDKWDQIAKECGFLGVSVEFRDHLSDEFHDVSVLVLTAVEHRISYSLSVHGTDHTYIAADTSNLIEESFAKSIRNRLSESGRECSISSHNDIYSDSVFQGRAFILLPSTAYLLGSAGDSRKAFELFKKIATSASVVLWTMWREYKDSGPIYGLAHGLCRSIRSEIPKLRLVTLTLEQKSHIMDHATMVCNVFKYILDTIPETSHESDLMEVNGILHTHRVVESRDWSLKTLYQARGYTDKVQRFGSVEALRLVTERKPNSSFKFFYEKDDVPFTPIQEDHIEIRVKAMGCHVSGNRSSLGPAGPYSVGLGVSGIVTKVGSNGMGIKVGDPVMAMTRDSFRTYIRTKANLVFAIPKGFSILESASIPINFATAYWALVVNANISKGDTILVHSAASGVGQAAVQIAQHIGAVVYATVDTEAESTALQTKYEMLSCHISNNEDGSLASSVMFDTQNTGVDIFLNCVSGEIQDTHWECLAPGGRFIDISTAMNHHTARTIGPMKSNSAFFSLDIQSLLTDYPEKMGAIFQSSGRMIEEMPFQPLEAKTFKPSEASKALSFIQNESKSRSAIIAIDGNDMVLIRMPMEKQFSLESNATYVIAGGLGGLGRSIAWWMASRGADNLLLLSRSGASGSDSMRFLQNLRASGITVEAPACDIGDKKALSTLLQYYDQVLPPIRGCIQASMVLRDRAFENMSHDDFEIPLQSKLRGSWNLHVHLPRSLSFFIMLSSVAGVFGKSGQANYAAASTYQDGLAHYRRSKGEVALSIDLGPVDFAGHLSTDLEKLHRLITTDGLELIDKSTFFALLDSACSSKPAAQIITGLGVPSILRVNGRQRPEWMNQPPFRALHRISPARFSTRKDHREQTEEHLNLYTAFQANQNRDALEELILEALKTRINRILPGTFNENDEIGKMKLSAPLHTLGVDSLVSISLRDWLRQEAGSNIPSFEILGNTSAKELAHVVVVRSKYLPSST